MFPRYFNKEGFHFLPESEGTTGGEKIKKMNRVQGAPKLKVDVEFEAGPKKKKMSVIRGDRAGMLRETNSYMKGHGAR